MAGYYIYSLDWDKFQRVVTTPSRPQLLTLAEIVSDGLDEFDGEFDEDDPIQDWPSEPEELCDIVQQRLRRDDWYGDLSKAGKDLWEWAFTGFCNDERPKDVGFRVESDGIYWDVIDVARNHHGIPPDRITDSILSQFGHRPYRYRPVAGHSRGGDDWYPNHSMHTPGEVQKLLEELKAAEAAMRAATGEQVRLEYEKELMPAVEKTARSGRMLYIAVDT